MKIIMAILLYAFSINALAYGNAWAWFSSHSGVSRWDIHQGNAIVSINNGLLHAELRDQSDGTIVYTIDGKVVGSKVSAKVIINDSDIGPMPVTGTYRVQQWKGEVKGFRETIILSTGFDVFGITRDEKE